MPKSPAPTRATSTMTIMFGLVPVPLRLFSATSEPEAPKRKMITPAGNPVNRPNIDSVTREEVPSAACKKVVFVDDVPVELTDEEIAAVTAPVATDRHGLPIETFIPVDAIERDYWVSARHQARPALRTVSKGGKEKKEDDPVANKAFTLLLSALQEKQVAALVRVSLRGPARYAALMPDGRLLFLHYDKEVREDFAFPEDVTLSDGEKALAAQIVDEIGVSTPELIDESSNLILEYVTKKAAGEVDVPVATSKVEPELDLSSLLAASIGKAS